MRRKQILMILTAVLAAGVLAAVPEPLARWCGDFTQTVKGDFTLNANGNMVAADGSTITIAQAATRGVTIDYPESKGVVTVVVRYSNYVCPTNDTAFLTAHATGSASNLSPNADRCGFLVRNSGNAAPIWNAVRWTSGAETTFSFASEGCVAYCYNHSSNSNDDRKGWLFTADWRTDWSVVAKWGNVAGVDANHVPGCAIGGPCDNTTCALASCAGLTIDEIILLPGCASVDDLNAVCPPARRLPLPTAWFSSDVGVQTNGDGAVIGWANRGSLGASLDVSAVGDGITLQEGGYGDKPAVVFPGGTTYTNYLTAAGTSTLGLRAAGLPAGRRQRQVGELGAAGLRERARLHGHGQRSVPGLLVWREPGILF